MVELDRIQKFSCKGAFRKLLAVDAEGFSRSRELFLIALI